MAKCEVVNIIKEFNLILTQKELDTLYLVCRRIGGNSKTSSRKYIVDIKDSIEDLISDGLRLEVDKTTHIEKYFDCNFNGIEFFDNINE